MVEATQLFQFLANGVVYGSILALGAIGLTLVYGILRLANFAHGDFIALGAFASYYAAVQWGGRLVPMALVAALVVGLLVLWGRRGNRLGRGEAWSAAGLALALGASALLVWAVGPGGGTTNLKLLVAVLVAVLVVAGLAVGLEFAVWRPLRRRGSAVLTLIIVSIGVALVVRNLLLLEYGGTIYSYDRPTAVADPWFGIRVTGAQQFVLVAALVLIGLVHVFLKYTPTGKALRAVSDNPELARASGIDVDRFVVYVWVLGGGLTAVAGVLLSLAQNSTMAANMGFFLLLPLFASVILGGIGSAYGAIAGAFLVGISMKLSVLWMGSEYEAAAAFLLLIVVLILRPQGVFGGRVA